MNIFISIFNEAFMNKLTKREMDWKEIELRRWGNESKLCLMVLNFVYWVIYHMLADKEGWSGFFLNFC
jgi:hypothetical protein